MEVRKHLANHKFAFRRQENCDLRAIVENVGTVGKNENIHRVCLGESFLQCSTLLNFKLNFKTTNYKDRVNRRIVGSN